MKRILFAFAIILVILGGFYFYYLHVPAIEPPILQGDLQSAELGVGSLRREFAYYQPGRLAADTPFVFVLHGSMGEGAQARRMFGHRFDQLADRHGFIAVYPTGFDRHWNDCRAAVDYRANIEDVDDIAFFCAMIDFLKDSHRSDPCKVLVTGMSNGGQMAYKLALAGHLRPTATLELADSNTEDGSVVELTAWQSPGLDEIIHYAVIGGGHVVPSRIVRLPRLLGATNADIEAADEI